MNRKEVRREWKRTLNKVDWIVRVTSAKGAPSIEELCRRSGITDFLPIRTISEKIREVSKKRHPGRFLVPKVLITTLKDVCKELRRKAEAPSSERGYKQPMHRAVTARRMA